MFGGILKAIGSAFGAAPPKAPAFDVPTTLPALGDTSAAALAEKVGLKLAADAPVAKTNSAPELVSHLLNEKEDMLGATQALAHGLPPQDGVKWAVDSCKKIEDKLPPEGREAIAAADAFARMPNAANRAAAAAASAKAGLESPAGLAAKAASLAPATDAPAVPGADKVLPALISGAIVCAVALSAAKPKPKDAAAKAAEKTPPPPPAPANAAAAGAPPAPAPPPPGPGSPESARNANAFKPFIEAGLALAAAKLR